MSDLLEILDNLEDQDRLNALPQQLRDALNPVQEAAQALTRLCAPWDVTTDPRKQYLKYMWSLLTTASELIFECVDGLNTIVNQDVDPASGKDLAQLQIKTACHRLHYAAKRVGNAAGDVGNAGNNDPEWMHSRKATNLFIKITDLEYDVWEMGEKVKAFANEFYREETSK